MVMCATQTSPNTEIQRDSSVTYFVIEMITSMILTTPASGRVGIFGIPVIILSVMQSLAHEELYGRKLLVKLLLKADDQLLRFSTGQA
jgi:hypothetical protein